MRAPLLNPVRISRPKRGAQGAYYPPVPMARLPNFEREPLEPDDPSAGGFLIVNSVTNPAAPGSSQK
jgi:hypothetical protein